MTIIKAIQAAVAAGKLQEPFTLPEVAATISPDYQYGSIQAALSRYSSRRRNQADPPLTRVGPGQYRLACRPAER